MATIINTRDLDLQSEATRMVNTTVAIMVDSSFYTEAFGGTTTPTSINVTAVPTIFTSPIAQWQYSNSSAPESWTTFGTGSLTQNITATNYLSYLGSSNWVNIKVTLSQNGYTSSSTSTQLNAIKSPELPVVIECSPASSVVQAYSDGTSYGYTATAATVKVKVGSNYLPYSTGSSNCFTIIGAPTQSPSAVITGGNSYSAIGITACNIATITGMVPNIDSVTLNYLIRVKNKAGATTDYELARIFTKAKNGSSGYTGIVVALTNDAHTIPTDSAGNNGNFSGSGTQVHVYEGDTELTYGNAGTLNGTYVVTKVATGITSSTAITLIGGTTYATNVDATAMSADVANINFTVTGKTSNGTAISQRVIQTFSKAKSGTNATAYWVSGSVPAVAKALAGTFTPTVVTYSSFTNTAGTTAAYTGAFKIYLNGSGTATTTTSGVSTAPYTIPGGTTSIKCELWNAALTTLLDTEGTGVVSDGQTGTGTPGDTGNSARIMYGKATSSTTFTNGSTYTTSGSTSFPDTGTHFGVSGITWQATPPSYAAGESLFQSTGTYTVSTNNTIWTTPYLSNLKVGSLSAITINTGALTVNNTGHIIGGKTGYTDNTNAGFYLGYDSTFYKLKVGTATKYIDFNGTDLYISSASVSGDFKANGNGGSTAESITINGVTKTYIDYSVYGIGASAPTAADSFRVGVYGRSDTTSANAAFSIGVMGYSNRTTYGIGTVGIATNGVGAYFEGATYGLISTCSAGVAGHFNGTIVATNNITAYSSDRRLKNVESYIDNAVDSLSKLSCFRYKWNDIGKSFGYTERTEIGLFAQEVDAVFPEVVHPSAVNVDKDTDYLTLQYERLVPVLIQAVKELNNKIIKLEGKVV